MASRSIEDLSEEMKERANAFLAACTERNLPVLIYCTLRPLEEQARLYRKGRSIAEIKRKADELRSTYQRPDLAELLLGVGPQAGNRIVTNAGPGQSLHNYGLAFDGAPLVDGKIVWDENDPVWQVYGTAARTAELDWAGDWEHFREYPHCQLPGGSWKELIRG